MKNMLTRRRFLTIFATSMASAGFPVQASERTSWKGRAMGAEASMQLVGPIAEPEARSIFRAVEQELARLERIFSLYQPGSQIVQLNKTGILKAPSPDILEVLSLCDALNTATNGAFDPTIQSLWLAHAEAATHGRALSSDEKAVAHDNVGWDHLSFDAGEVRLDRDGCGITLNGIAQGYVTDQIAALLRQRGLTDILIDMGEIAAVGQKRWKVGIATPTGDIADHIILRDRAIATSAPMGTILVPAQRLGHILDPRQLSEPGYHLVSVSARSAALADGLSTAFCLMQRAEIETCLTQFAETRLETLI